MWSIRKEFIEVDDVHTLCLYLCGNKSSSRKFLFLHGGPGHYFDLNRHLKAFNPHLDYVISFDQRGCGQSKPLGCLNNNTPTLITNDIITILDHLSIEKVTIVGGSWGGTLALLFAYKFPGRVLKLILRSPWIWNEDSIKWIWGGELKNFFFREWYAFKHKSKTDTQVIIDYRNLLFGENLREAREAAIRWLNWEEKLCCYKDRPNYIKSEISKELFVMAQFECHFVVEFTSQVGSELSEMTLFLQETPYEIVTIQGVFDFLCPIGQAESFFSSFNHVKMIRLEGGHKADFDPIRSHYIRHIGKSQTH
jgi:proline iminopeptidase